MAEKEYIEREALIEGLMMYTWRDTDGWEIDDSDAKRAFIEEWLPPIPAADVRPVVKARWVYTNMSRLVCSNCGNPVAFALKEDGWHHGDFCPNCGARMEES